MTWLSLRHREPQQLRLQRTDNPDVPGRRKSFRRRQRPDLLLILLPYIHSVA